MPTVYVTHLPHRKDPVSGEFVPAMNLAPATEFGQLVFMFPPRASFLQSELLLKRLSVALKDYDASAGDCLLPLGNCVLIAAAITILARKGAYNILTYDRMIRKYSLVRIA